MDVPIPTLEEVVKLGNELSLEVTHHPAIVQDEIKKKESKHQDVSDNAMEVHYGDELDQIEMANKLVAGIDDHIRIMYKAIREEYSHRFPELKIAQPMQYIITAQLLGNKPDRVSDEAIKEQLSEFLEPKMHLLVTMSAATTQGIKIEPEKMERIMQACSVAIHLANLRAKLLSFVEKNMTVIAPNLSIILGTPIAAKLMGLAGGLMNFANMPSCNIPILGSHKMSNIESDVSAPPPRVGHIYECDLIQQIPFDHTKDVRRRAVRWVANKCVLAARCDVSHADQEGNAGRRFREEIEAKINRELEPPPKKAPRPLPAPIEKSSKKRGGKRVRRMKERYEVTELRKAANRVAFGDVGDDAYQNDLGMGRNQLTSAQRLRGPQINTKTKVKLSKNAQKKLVKQNQDNHIRKDSESKTTAVIQATNSTAASVTLKSEQQELKISNPDMQMVSNEKSTSSKNSYFSSTCGFLNLKQEQHK